MTRKILLVLLAGFFAMLFSFGYHVGHQAVWQQADFSQLFALSQIEIEETDNRYYFVYREDDQAVYVYDPDRNAFEHSLNSASSSIRRTSLRSFRITTLFAPSFVSSISLGYTLKDLLRDPDPIKNLFTPAGASHRRKFFYSGLGAVSGFGAGFFAATWSSRPSEAEVRNILKDPDVWRKHEWAIFAKIASNISRLCVDIKDKEFSSKCKAKVRLIDRVSRGVQQEGLDLRSGHLSMLAALEKEVTPLYDASINEVSFIDYLAFALPFIVGGLFLAIVLWATLSDVLADRKAKMRRK